MVEGSIPSASSRNDKHFARCAARRAQRGAVPPGSACGRSKRGKAPTNSAPRSGRIPKRPTGPDCKSGGYAFAGSNPAPPTLPEVVRVAGRVSFVGEWSLVRGFARSVTAVRMPSWLATAASSSGSRSIWVVSTVGSARGVVCPQELLRRSREASPRLWRGPNKSGIRTSQASQSSWTRSAAADRLRPAGPRTPFRIATPWVGRSMPRGRSSSGCSSMVEPQPSKLVVRVRFPSPAPLVRAVRSSSRRRSFRHRPTPFRCCSSGVEHFLGKEEVMGSIPISSSKRWSSAGESRPALPSDPAPRAGSGRRGPDGPVVRFTDTLRSRPH